MSFPWTNWMDSPTNSLISSSSPSVRVISVGWTAFMRKSRVSFGRGVVCFATQTTRFSAIVGDLE